MGSFIFIFIVFSVEIPITNRVDPGEIPCSAASELGLQSSHMSL